MLYFKHTGDFLYSKYNEETGELVHASKVDADFSISLQVIEESQRELLIEELERNAEPVQEPDWTLFVDQIKTNFSKI